MVILEDSTMESVVVGGDRRWRDDGNDDNTNDAGDDDDKDMDFVAVKATFVEGWWGDGTPKAYAVGRALWSAMTARRVDAIIFMVEILYMYTLVFSIMNLRALAGVIS